jgi:hypothetical protein
VVLGVTSHYLVLPFPSGLFCIFTDFPFFFPCLTLDVIKVSDFGLSKDFGKCFASLSCFYFLGAFFFKIFGVTPVVLCSSGGDVIKVSDFGLSKNFGKDVLLTTCGE